MSEDINIMCGRFMQSKSAEELQKAFALLPVLSKLQGRYNIAPTQAVAAWLADPTPRMELFSWRFIPHWAKEINRSKPLINARAETLSDKPTFRDAYRRKRCVIPATGYYEWKLDRASGYKQAMLYQRRDRQAFGFAGLWDEWHDGEGGIILGCCIITTRPNTLARRIHHRMPAILREEEVQDWLNPELTDTKTLSRMLTPVPADEYEIYPVSPRVNSVKHDDRGLADETQPNQGQMSLDL